MKCDRFVFSVDGKLPGPDPANSSCDTERAGSGPFPSSPKEEVLVIKTYCPATSGISVSSCVHTCCMASWPEGSGVSYRDL